MLGIIGAVESEIEDIRAGLSETEVFEKAGLTYYHGRYKGRECVLSMAGVGKVNAALCTQIMIDKFSPSAIINTGTAGGLAPEVHIGDVVMSTEAIEHDMDCTKFGYRPGEIPDLKKSEVFDGVAFRASEEMRKLARAAAKKAVPDMRLLDGVILSGDEFVSSKEQKERLLRDHRGSCCEMEGAAIAHVCALNKVPFLILRAISDSADEGATDNYHDFEAKVAKNSAKLCLAMLELM